LSEIPELELDGGLLLAEDPDPWIVAAEVSSDETRSNPSAIELMECFCDTEARDIVYKKA
jgi:hypothetical protein